ncbi:maleylpyruvate isomerase N-terminal domain-containing protein [soil metagenome]
MTALTARDTYLRAARTFSALVDAVPLTSYDGPGLGAWDLRALVGHASRSLITVLDHLDLPADVAMVASAVDYYATGVVAATHHDAVVDRGRAAGAALGDDPAAAIGALVAAVGEKLPGFDDAYVLTTIAGPMQLVDYLPTRTFELVVHGLDVARATSLDAGYDEEVLAAATDLAARIAVRTGRGPNVLLALTGRDGLPPGFSVV